METLKKYKQSVFCTLSFDGIHAWYNCPIEEVDFLKVEHRHTFNVKAYYQVSHGDRDQEFIMLKRDIQDYLIPHQLLLQIILK